MHIRKAEEKDIPGILNLLSQVLELHAALRPDIFIPGTTKYTKSELTFMINEESRRIYVAADENDNVAGYAFCEIREQKSNNFMVPFTSIYIDDLCVDETVRGKHIGRQLFDHVRREAFEMGCYELTLNVWEGNDSAHKFYENMGFHPKSTTMEYIIGK